MNIEKPEWLSTRCILQKDSSPEEWLITFKKRKIIIPYLIIGLYFIFYVLGIILYKNGLGLLFEIQNLVKVFYFPIIFIALFSIKEEIDIDNKILVKTLYLYLILILIPIRHMKLLKQGH